MSNEKTSDKASEDPVLEERHGNVLLLRLNRPERHHALNLALTTRLAEALAAAEKDEEVRVVVLTGAGDKAFCAGADMLELSGAEASGTEASGTEGSGTEGSGTEGSGTEGSGAGEKDAPPTGAAGIAYEAIANATMPLIAAINGYCYGGGAQIAIGCDILLASETATFRLPGAEYGLVVAASSLPRLVGSSKAKEIIFTARKFDAQDALAWGMLSSVHAPDELLPAALALAEEIAANSVAAVAASKAVIDRATRVAEADDMEVSINRVLRGSPEQTERFRKATKRVTGR